MCRSKEELQQAILEASLLERFQGLTAIAPGQVAPTMRIPQYLAHTVDRRKDAWRVRMAMGRVPGEPLDAFLRRPPPPQQDGPRQAARRPRRGWQASPPRCEACADLLFHP
mmetsp:Transcript_33446/g.85518  ORF Transcript_33446/g.85518 Transcript_33446/m.85518 type:complete len:111 (+) Transcript_33446:444-776(+)